MSTQQQSDDYGTDTFVDPSDDKAVARLFNFPLAVRGSLPADLKASYAKLYSAHQRVLVQLATVKSEISTVKRENTTLHQRYQQAMDQAEQLLIVLKGLKDEKEHGWKSDSEDDFSFTPTASPEVTKGGKNTENVNNSPSPNTGPDISAEIEPLDLADKATPLEPSTSSEWVKPYDDPLPPNQTSGSTINSMPNKNPMMASMHAPKSVQRAPLNPHELLRRHLNMSISKSPVSGRLQGKNDNQQAATRAEEKEPVSLLPEPPARQKTVFCHCFTTCWEPGDATSCACRKAHEPCDPSKCHGPPKRVWLPWGNPDGKPCDCRWTGNKEEEEKYGFRENRLRRWLAGDRF